MHFSEITELIINAFFHVYNKLPRQLTESCYQNALVIALRKRGLVVRREVEFPIYYEGILVGNHRADIIVNDTVVIETKVAERVIKAHVIQTSRYLEVFGLPVGLILNFGPTADVRRVDRR